MVNQNELAICRRRGHHLTFLGDRWIQCKWCGMWLRQRKVLDEQEDAPPQSEINLLAKFMKEEDKVEASDAAAKTSARKKRRNPGIRKRK